MLLDVVELVKLIKRAAVDAVEATKPVNLCFGMVESVGPLRISVEQRMTLSGAQLIMPGSVAALPLSAGDKVILLRQQGGQKYFVIDRIGEM